MVAGGVQEGPELLGRPDLPKATGATTRTLRPFGGVRDEQLLRTDRVVEGLAQNRVNVVNGRP